MDRLAAACQAAAVTGGRTSLPLAAITRSCRARSCWNASPSVICW
ncbi:hypothetical protein B0E53_06792 [Micromonospora sp. MH33]|nr:hypothetical protein B0E53_06792 [Micromonospora sp. MH33]